MEKIVSSVIVPIVTFLSTSNFKQRDPIYEIPTFEKLLDLMKTRYQVLSCLAITNTIRLFFSMYLRNTNNTDLLLVWHLLHVLNMIPTVMYLLEEAKYRIWYILAIESLMLVG